MAQSTPSWHLHAERQAGIVTRQQALDAGMSRGAVDHQVRSRRWHVVHPGVYATFTGPLSFTARVWAALLHAGPDAVASHRTAGRLQGLIDTDPTSVEVSVPWGHRVSPRPGVRVHRTRQHTHRRHPARSLPQTLLEDTVLDLVEESTREDDVVAWLTRACQRRLSTPDRLRDAASQRPRMRHRRLVADVLADVRAGVHSALERHYRHDVERAHGLPNASRNGAMVRRGRRWYHDVRYRRWRLRVELEGLAFHPDDEGWRDDVRDNAAVLAGDAVLRYGWRAVVSHRCATASEVAGALHDRGWRGTARSCGPGCTVFALLGQPRIAGDA